MISIRRSISTLIVRDTTITTVAGITQGTRGRGRIQGMIRVGGAQGGGRMTGRGEGVAVGSMGTGIHREPRRVGVRTDVTVGLLLLSHGHPIGSLGHPHKIKRRKCQLLTYWLNILG
jgi:hypothetical protein